MYNFKFNHVLQMSPPIVQFCEPYPENIVFNITLNKNKKCQMNILAWISTIFCFAILIGVLIGGSVAINKSYNMKNKLISCDCICIGLDTYTNMQYTCKSQIYIRSYELSSDVARYCTYSFPIKYSQCKVLMIQYNDTLVPEKQFGSNFMNNPISDYNFYIFASITSIIFIIAANCLLIYKYHKNYKIKCNEINSFDKVIDEV